MKNYLNTAIIGFIFLFFILGCGGASSAPKPPTVTAFGDICKPENSGTNITVEGFIWTAKSVGCERTSKVTRMCSLELYETAEHKGKPVTVRFRTGSGNNEMEGLPEQFTQTDIKIKDDNYNLIPVDKKIRLKGYAETSGDTEDFKKFGCFINVKKIEVIK